MDSQAGTKLKFGRFEEQIKAIPKQFLNQKSKHCERWYRSIMFWNQVLIGQMILGEYEIKQCQAKYLINHTNFVKKKNYTNMRVNVKKEQTGAHI